MKIEIISKETIKPSSPTPPHLKTYNLSVIDQVILDPYVPIVLYYRNNRNESDGDSVRQEAEERSFDLKKSLSKTLTQFYPLAGTIKDDFLVDCNDVGAFYSVALVRDRLDEFLSRPDPRFISRILPRFDGFGPGFRITNVQVNVFECGGIAISLCISHKILDGAGLYTFLKAWTKNMSCGAKETAYSELSVSSLFPAKDLWLKDSATAVTGAWIKEGKCVTQRFVFGSESIEKLRSKAVKNGVLSPSRVTVVSALIWKCAMAASKEACGLHKPSRLTHLVNLRAKLETTKEFIGNVVWPTGALCQPSEEITFHGLVKKVREGISRINVEFVKKAQGENGHVAMRKSIDELGEIAPRGAMNTYCFTSWCKMGYYEIDFGWGKPSWVSGFIYHGNPVYVNQVTLIDSSCGGGIEAWIAFDEEEVKILQDNQELLAYASLNPSVLPK